MRVGLTYNMRNPPRWFQPWPAYYAQGLEHLEEMDRLGFEVLSFAEHHGDTDGFNPAVAAMLTAAAVRTERALIGTNIIQTPFHHPVNLAEELAAVDILSNGRLEPGFAPGQGRVAEHQVFGIPLKQRFSMHTEAVEIIRRCWTEDEPFSHHGRHWHLEDVWINPKPVQRPPRIFVTGMGAGSMDRAARLGYGVMAPGGGHLAGGADREVWEAWHTLWRAGLERHGRSVGDLEVSTFGSCFITDDPEKAWAEYGDIVEYTTGYVTGGVQPYARAASAAAGRPSVRFTFCTAEQAIANFRDAFGTWAPNELLLRGALPGMTWEAATEFHRNFAKQVLPVLKVWETAQPAREGSS